MKFIKKLQKFNLLALILLWRISLFVPQILAISFLPNQQSYLGGGIAKYLQNPFLWSWANFDGEHYLGIVQFGYRPLTYFFFPLYPTLVRTLGTIFGTEIGIIYLVSAILISLVCTVAAFYYLRKLLLLDYKKKIVWEILLLIIVFPTSFFFFAVYTESLFLLLVVAAFYFARTNKWLIACLIASLATSTRLIGIVLLPALFVELILQKRTKSMASLYLFLIPLGLLAYMNYLNKTVADPLAFFHSIEIFGDQRSTHLVVLPQVFYRYFVKIIPNLSFSFFPVVYTTLLEIVVAILFLFSSLYALVKLRLSYAVYLIGGYIVPTLSGSFSSLPRYVVVLFPAFIVFSSWIRGIRPIYKGLIFAVFICALIIGESLFVRGYWVS